MRLSTKALFLAGALGALAVLAVGAESPPVAPTGVTIPPGYRDWVVVAPSQRDDKDELRVILANPIALKAFRTNTLPFPDGSILAKIAWKRKKSDEFADTFIPGEQQRFEFMVKDPKKWASTGGWGFGRFINGKPADAEQHATCWPCHQANVKNHDWVFTRLPSM